MSPKYIFIPGLSDRTALFRWFYELTLWFWRKRGFDAILLPMYWSSTEDYEDKVQRSLYFIDKFIDQGREVVLVGSSAGAAIVMALFGQRLTDVKAVVLISGYIRVAYQTERYCKHVWYQAALASEGVVKTLPASYKKHILSLYPRQDATVDPTLARIPGATNQQLPIVGHIVSIVVGLLFYRSRIRNFVKQL